MKYEVTIGIPVYNAERFIGRSLGSALMQSFGSIEFLVIDDCSTDGTLDVVRRLQEEHPRGGDIRIVTQPVNKGVGQPATVLSARCAAATSFSSMPTTP